MIIILVSNVQPLSQTLISYFQVYTAPVKPCPAVKNMRGAVNTLAYTIVETCLLPVCNNFMSAVAREERVWVSGVSLYKN